MISGFLATVYEKYFKLREKLFRQRAIFDYLPAKVSPIMLPAIMDLFWLPLGMVGFNKCFVAKGIDNSKRFDSNSSYYQAWIGVYHINIFKKLDTDDKVAMLNTLLKAAISDQANWLRLYGVKVKPDSIKVIESETLLMNEYQHTKFPSTLYSGEITTLVDDYYKLHRPDTFFFKLTAKTLAIYNRSKVPDNFLNPDDGNLSMNSRINMKGFFKVFKITPRKFCVAYAASEKEAFKLNQMELLKSIESVRIT